MALDRKDLETIGAIVANQIAPLTNGIFTIKGEMMQSISSLRGDMDALKNGVNLLKDDINSIKEYIPVLRD